jgi:hypothetical protein
MCKNTLQERNGKMENLLNINGAEDSLSSYIQIPYYRLKKSGEFVTLDESRKKIEFVWLALSKSRVLWGKYDPDEREVKPLCRSANGMNADGGTVMRQTPCQNCPDSKWQGQTKRPDCAEVFTMLCWDLEKSNPFYFQIKRTAIKSLKAFNNALKIGSLNSKSGFAYHLCVKSSLTARTDKTKFGDIYVPEFAILGGLSEEKQAEFYYNLATQLAKELQNIKFDNEIEEEQSYPEQIFPEKSCPEQSYPKPSQANQTIQASDAKPNGSILPILPKITDPNWMASKVGLKQTAELTWLDLVQNKMLPDQTPGGLYLQRLAKWSEQPGIAELAQVALHS